jgi:cysteine-rich repeat protein
MRKFLWKAILPLTMMLALQGCKDPEAGNCADEVDNDKNGQIDCADAACAADPACAPDPELCNDTIDNDGDGDIDCADADCAADPLCAVNDLIGTPCDADADCGDGNCVDELALGFPSGYCSDICDDADPTSCGNGAVCLLVGFIDPANGTCFDSCDPAGNDCRDGYACADLGNGAGICFPSCDADAQCPAVGFCQTDPNDINAGFCATELVIAAGCTDGIDNDLDGAIDCDDNECVDDPACAIVCGDGTIAGTEACDDGNITAGDGCDAVCAVEIGFACSGEPSVCVALQATCDAAAVAQLGANTGDTLGGTNLFTGQTCLFGAGAGSEQIFSFIPGIAGQTGTLSIVLASATDQGVYVTTNCVDPNSEIGCVDNQVGGTDETLDVAVTDAGVALAIFVDAFLDGEEGPFTMTLSFTSDICGNALVTGGEGCDDGNTTAGDGCNAACAVEAGFACSGEPSVCVALQPTCDAAVAAVVGNNLGDTATGSALFIGPDPGIFADCPFAGVGGGSEVLFSFTPAATGTMTLTLVSVTDLGVYVRTTCADDTTFVGCADAAFPGNPNGSEDTEVTTVAVTAGVPLTIFADSFTAADDGPFTLTIAVQ